jgi:hypothetical protein
VQDSGGKLEKPYEFTQDHPTRHSSTWPECRRVLFLAVILGGDGNCG